MSSTDTEVNEEGLSDHPYAIKHHLTSNAQIINHLNEHDFKNKFGYKLSYYYINWVDGYRNGRNGYTHAWKMMDELAQEEANEKEAKQFLKKLQPEPQPIKDRDARKEQYEFLQALQPEPAPEITRQVVT